MKNLLCSSAITCCIAFVALSCSKGKNDYAPTDHTVGLVSGRKWSGQAYGYYYRDTVIATNPAKWPGAYNRNLTDTVITIERINSSVISVGGAWLIFRSIDSVTKMIYYDSTYAGAPRSFLVYDFGNNTMSYEYHKTHEYHAPSGHSYQTNLIMNSAHP